MKGSLYNEPCYLCTVVMLLYECIQIEGVMVCSSSSRLADFGKLRNLCVHRELPLQPAWAGVAPTQFLSTAAASSPEFHHLLHSYIKLLFESENRPHNLPPPPLLLLSFSSLVTEFELNKWNLLDMKRYADTNAKSFLQSCYIIMPVVKWGKTNLREILIGSRW